MEGRLYVLEVTLIAWGALERVGRLADGKLRWPRNSVLLLQTPLFRLLPSKESYSTRTGYPRNKIELGRDGKPKKKINHSSPGTRTCAATFHNPSEES